MLLGVRTDNHNAAVIDPRLLTLAYAPLAEPGFGSKNSPEEIVARVSAAAEPVLKAGQLPYITMNPHPTATISKQLDRHFAAIAQWADNLGVPVWFSLWPQSEKIIADLGTAIQFTNAHICAYQVMRLHAGQKVQIGPCYTANAWLPPGPSYPTSEAWLVPEPFADFYAATCYTSALDWKTVGLPLEERADFQHWLRLAGQHQVPILLTGRGITGRFPGIEHDAGGQGLTLTNDHEYLERLGALGLIYDSTGPYALNDIGRTVLTDIGKREAGDLYMRGVAAGLAATVGAGLAEQRFRR